MAHVVRAQGVSQRRACKALAVDRSSVRHCSVRPDDAERRAAIKAVAAERRRFGYLRGIVEKPVGLHLERSFYGRLSGQAA